jgi:hypothetical protein
MRLADIARTASGGEKQKWVPGICRIYSLSAAPSLSQSVEIAWQSPLQLAQYCRLWSVRARYYRHPLGRPSRREPIADVAELAGYGRNFFPFPHCRRFLRYRSTKPLSKMVRMRMSRRVFSSRKYLLGMDRGVSERRLQVAYGLQADMFPFTTMFTTIQISPRMDTRSSPPPKVPEVPNQQKMIYCCME